MRRMPTRTQRRNTAYLNRPISRFGPLDRGPRGPGTVAQTGLAIYLGDSVDFGCRPGDGGAFYLGEPHRWLRRVIEAGVAMPELRLFK